MRNLLVPITILLLLSQLIISVATNKPEITEEKIENLEQWGKLNEKYPPTNFKAEDNVFTIFTVIVTSDKQVIIKKEDKEKSAGFEDVKKIELKDDGRIILDGFELPANAFGILAVKKSDGVNFVVDRELVAVKGKNIKLKPSDNGFIITADDGAIIDNPLPGFSYKANSGKLKFIKNEFEFSAPESQYTEKGFLFKEGIEYSYNTEKGTLNLKDTPIIATVGKNLKFTGSNFQVSHNGIDGKITTDGDVIIGASEDQKERNQVIINKNAWTAVNNVEVGFTKEDKKYTFDQQPGVVTRYETGLESEVINGKKTFTDGELATLSSNGGKIQSIAMKGGTLHALGDVNNELFDWKVGESFHTTPTPEGGAIHRETSSRVLQELEKLKKMAEGDVKRYTSKIKQAESEIDALYEEWDKTEGIDEYFEWAIKSKENDIKRWERILNERNRIDRARKERWDKILGVPPVASENSPASKLIPQPGGAGTKATESRSASVSEGTVLQPVKVAPPVAAQVSAPEVRIPLTGDRNSFMSNQRTIGSIESRSYRARANIKTNLIDTTQDLPFRIIQIPTGTEIRYKQDGKETIEQYPKDTPIPTFIQTFESKALGSRTINEVKIVVNSLTITNID